MATTSSPSDTSTLPLAGIKVLDMTRVLAGVSSAIAIWLELPLTFNSHIALKYSEI